MDDHSASENKTTVPHCELVAKWIKGDQQVKPLEHTVDILGTTDEEKYFTIIIDPGKYLMQPYYIELNVIIIAHVGISTENEGPVTPTVSTNQLG